MTTVEQFRGFRKIAFQTKPSLRFQTGIIVRRGNPLPTPLQNTDSRIALP